MNGNIPIEELYDRYLRNRLSEEELNDFLLKLHDPQNESKVDIMMQETWEDMYERQSAETKVIPLWRRGFFRKAAAAVIIVALGAAAYLIFLNPERRNEVVLVESQEKRFKNDVAPGTNNAILTLADGSQVVLDSAQSGSLATEGHVQVNRTAGGQIVYQPTAPVTEIKYNTITVPKGSRVVHLVLADGSKIWLDASSSLRYPTAFVGKDRRVEITGQAYFEVTHNPSKPFTVHFTSGGGKEGEIQVLGTHFNVMAFHDEDAMKVTLLEGSVKVAKGANTRTIQPGEQAILAQTRDNIELRNDIDLGEVMAWKNGVFKFQDITIEPLMKQLVRWYDVEVVFQDKPTDRFVSTIPRDVPASQVFKILETTGRVHFKIEGKKVTVMK